MFQLHGDLRDYAWGATGLDTIITQVTFFFQNKLKYSFFNLGHINKSKSF
jgi:hypothetical protein